MGYEDDVAKALFQLNTDGAQRRRARRDLAAARQLRANKRAGNTAAFFQGAKKAGATAVAAPGKALNAKMSVADIGRGVGVGAGKVGSGAARLLSSKPGLTGAAVIGGSGYGVYRLGRDRNDKKEKVTKSAFGVEHYPEG